MVGEVGGEFGHAPGVAGGTEAAALAGERDQALVATVLTARACEAVGEDPTPEVGPEVLLHPGGEPAARGVGVGGLGEEGLEVVLDDLVEGRGRGPPGPVGRR